MGGEAVYDGPMESIAVIAGLIEALGVNPYQASAIFNHPAEFVLGVAESGGNVGMTYDSDPTSGKSLAYDVGRDVGTWGPRPVAG